MSTLDTLNASCSSQIVQLLPARWERAPKTLEFPRGFQLEDLHPYLSQEQRAVILAATALTERFSRGRICHLESLDRVLAHYHGIRKKRSRMAIKSLCDLRILGRTESGNLRLVPTAVDFLTRSQREELESMLEAMDRFAA